MANLLALKDETFENEVLQSSVPVLVDFSATWCGPCKALAPTLEKLSTEYDGKVKFTAVDIDQARQTAARFGVMSVPTVLLFRNGAVVAQGVGNQPRDYWIKMLDQVLAS